VTQVRSNDGIGMTVGERRRPPWLANGLLVLGAWLVVSPLLLGTAQVTAGATSAVTSGLALMVLSGWTRVARNRVPPMLIALAFGVWLLLAPSMWEFADGVDAWALVPIPASDVIEPTRAAIARAEWNSILAGLLILALAGSVLAAAARRRSGRRPSAGREGWRQVEASDRRR
jgi:hypothetical protein